MANMNLSTGDIKEDSGLKIGQGGTAMLFIILILILVIYGAELLYRQKLTRDTQAIQTEFTTKYKSLSTGNPITVVDFQNRLIAARKAIAEGRDARENLLEIEKDIIPGSYIKSYKFDQKAGAVTLGCVGDNYNIAAKQILNFKKSSFFANASGGETTFIPETGKVEFMINLKLK